MTRLVLLLIFTLTYFSTTFSQNNLSDYSFVAVPEKFDFLDERDQYQLNSISKHLFNSNGFHAYFTNELPNVRRCDGVWADVEGSPGFVYTRVTVILKDCNGVEVYRSEEGKSKIKDYNRTYHAALRNAFRSITALNVNQKEITVFGEDEMIDTPAKPAVLIEEIEVSEVKNPRPVITSVVTLNLPKEKFVSYSIDKTTFLLRKTEKGYSLYEETKNTDGGLQLLGKIMNENNKITFIDVDGSVFDARFDVSENLYIFKEDPPLVYKRTR